jgi:hypothetical protein
MWVRKYCWLTILGARNNVERPRTKLSCGSRINELHAVLKNAGVGVRTCWLDSRWARLYASQYPAEAAGMFIVDHAFLLYGREHHQPFAHLFTAIFSKISGESLS